MMATPIEPTPVFEGEDAELLLSELAKVHLSEEQRKKRRETCKMHIEERMRPKGYKNQHVGSTLEEFFDEIGERKEFEQLVTNKMNNYLLSEKCWEQLQLHFLASPIIEENDDIDGDRLI
jgi:hypothetical protein